MKPKKNPVRDLPRGVSIRKTCNGHGREMWRVRLGRKFTRAAVKERNFPTLAAARDFIHGDAQAEGVAALREKFGVVAVEMSPRELAEAREALAALRAAKAGTLREAVRYYLRHNSAKRMSVADAIAAFVRAKQSAGRIAKHVAALKSHVTSLVASSHVGELGELQAAHVERWLGELNVAPITKANALRAVRVFFRFCRARGWMPQDPLAGVESPQVIPGETRILSPAQARALLAAVEDRRVLAGLALKLFAGVRTSELLALDWEDVSAAHVVIRASNAKTRRRRVIEAPENLAAWLAPLRKAAGKVAPLPSRVWHEMITQAAEDADKAAEAGGVPGKPLIGELPQNFARHSFGTYHFALHQDEARTAAAMGNTPAMVHRHYRALATADDAREFFAIMPETAGQILAFAS